MIRTVFILLGICLSIDVSSQYYYKDLLSAQQTASQMKKYQAAGVKNITVTSFENDGERTVDFEGTQSINNNYTSIQTSFKTQLAGESQLTTYFNNKGQVIKTVDTTDGSGSVNEYKYDNTGRLTIITNISTSPGMHIEKEEHAWFYNANGKPERMLRIKNDVDTSYVSFVLDERGNITEENSRRKGTAQTSYYYYYDNKDRLTDIVTYNEKAKRLLPVYVFEYNQQGALASMMVIPEGSDDYQKWQYQYNSSGLKSKETCFNKRRQVLGRVEYAYR